LSSVGGIVYFTAHVLHESGDSEVAASAALVILYGLGELVLASFYALGSSSIPLLVFLVVLVLLSLALYMHGFPCHKIRTHHIAQYVPEHERCKVCGCTDGKHTFAPQ
jgi:uncharacterized membrane protein